MHCCEGEFFMGRWADPNFWNMQAMLFLHKFKLNVRN